MRGQDVDEMLEGMPPEKFDEYVAMDRVLPFGDEKLAWTLAKGFAAITSRLNLLCEAWGAKDMAELKPVDFIPWKAKPKKKREYVSPNAMARAATIAAKQAKG